MNVQELVDSFNKNKDSCSGNCDECPLFLKEIPDCILRDPTSWNINIDNNVKTVELKNLIEETVVFEIPKVKELLTETKPIEQEFYDFDDDEEDKNSKALMIILNILCVVLFIVAGLMIYWILAARGII